MKKTHRLKARNIVGKKIKEVRLSSKPAISQEDLAGRLAAMGILLDRSAISRIENQTRYLMDYELAAIAKCLKTKIALLFGKEE